MLGQDAEGIATRVRGWLEADGWQCILVFDNAVDIDGLRRFLPAAGDAEVVVTSTRQAAGLLGTSVPVDVFTKDEALAFLAERTGRAGDADARELADELGCLPLALAQAAAVIVREHLDCGTYLERLRTLPLDSFLPPVEGDPYPRGLAEAVLLSLASVEATDDTGICGAVMDLLAVLSPTGVPRRLLHDCIQVGMLHVLKDGRLSIIGFWLRLLIRYSIKRRNMPREIPGEAFQEPWLARSPDPTLTVRLDKALGQLADASLISFSLDNSAVAAHRMTMRVVRERMLADSKLRLDVLVALGQLGWLVDHIDSVWEDPTLARQVAVQINALGENASPHLSEFGILFRTSRLPKLLELRAKSVSILCSLGDNPDLAIDLASRLVVECQQVLGNNHVVTLVAGNSLAGAYKAAGRLDEAIAQYEALRTDFKRIHIPGGYQVDLRKARKKFQYDLAGAYMTAGRLDEAITQYEALGKNEKRKIHWKTILGTDHPNILDIYWSLAKAYETAGCLDEAITQYNRTISGYKALLADRESLLGTEHPKTLDIRSALAGAYKAAGRPDDAITQYEAVLTDSTRILGTEHPKVLDWRWALAGAYKAAGRPDDAITQYEAVLTDSTRILGTEHPKILNIRWTLAAAYRAAGRLEEASAQYSEAIPGYEARLADRERVLGSDDPKVLDGRWALAAAYRAAGRLDDAITQYEALLTDSTRILGTEHPNTLSVRSAIAAAYRAAGRLDDAITQYEAVLTDSTRILGTEHPKTLHIRSDLAAAYRAAGRLEALFIYALSGLLR